MNVLDAIRKRAEAYRTHGTPGLNAPKDRAQLLAALEAVVGLHKPEKRWMPYRDADVSYDTAEEAARDLSHSFTIDPSNMPFFELCAHCKKIEEGPCDGECTREMGYRESLWPCPTITALTAALGDLHVPGSSAAECPCTECRECIETFRKES